MMVVSVFVPSSLIAPLFLDLILLCSALQHAELHVTPSTHNHSQRTEFQFSYSMTHAYIVRRFGAILWYPWNLHAK